MKKVLVLGGVSFDTIIHLNRLPEPKPTTIHYSETNETVGSTGAGKAFCLAKLNMDTTLQGLMGLDTYGEKIKCACRERNINYLYEIDPKGTERHTNLMDKQGRRISIYTNSSSFEPNVNYEAMEEYIKCSDYIVLNIINYCRNYIPLIKKYNKEIWTDLHDYDGKNPYHSDFMEAADYITMSSDCLEDYKTVMKELIGKGKKLVVCTHGKDGVSAIDAEGNWYDLPIINGYKMKDANGAGDNFFSGVLYGHSKGYPILKCLQLGTITAGLCITSPELVYELLTEELLNAEYDKYFA